MGSGASSRRRIKPRDVAKDDLPVLMAPLQRRFERQEQASGLGRIVPILSQARDQCDLIGDTPPALSDVPVRFGEVLALLLEIRHGGSYARYRA